MSTRLKKKGLMSMFQRLRVLAFLLIFIGVIILPINSHATQPTSPIDVDIGFDNPNPELNSPETLSLRITSIRDIPGVTVDVLLPQEVRLIAGDTSLSGDLNKGETVEFSMVVEIVETGRFSITVNVLCSPDVPFVCSRRLHLNMIVTDDEVRASTKPFILMDLERTKTPEEREDLLRMPGIEVPTPFPPPTVPPTLPEFLILEEAPSITDKEHSERSDVEAIATIATVTVTVSGKMTYYDSAGNEHPIRYAKVKVVDVDEYGPVVEDYVDMGEGYTLADGTYQITATGGDIGSGPDIRVIVYSAIVADLVAYVEAPSTIGDTKYSMESSTYTDYTATTLNHCCPVNY